MPGHPSPPRCPPGPHASLQGEMEAGGRRMVPRPTGHISSTGSPLLQCYLGPRFALCFLTVITESSSLEGRVSPLRASLGPAALEGWPPPSCPPLPSARGPSPSPLPGGRGEQKVPLCTPGRLEGSCSASVAPPPAGACLCGPAGHRRRAREPSRAPSCVTAPCCDWFSVIFAVDEGCSCPGGWGAETQ